MLSAIMLAFDTPQAAPERANALRRESVLRSLHALIEACVAGVIGDAVLTGPPEPVLRKIADEAGCALIEAEDARKGLRSALAIARRADILVMTAGYAVEPGFADEIRDLFAFGERGPRVLRAAPDSLLTRLAPGLAKPVGLIARKEDLRGGEGIARLARRLRARDLAARARRAV
jgi:hypothetical protein